MWSIKFKMVLVRPSYSFLSGLDENFEFLKKKCDEIPSILMVSDSLKLEIGIGHKLL